MDQFYVWNPSPAGIGLWWLLFNQEHRCHLTVQSLARALVEPNGNYLVCLNIKCIYCCGVVRNYVILEICNFHYLRLRLHTLKLHTYFGRFHVLFTRSYVPFCVCNAHLRVYYTQRPYIVCFLVCMHWGDDIRVHFVWGKISVLDGWISHPAKLSCHLSFCIVYPHGTLKNAVLDNGQCFKVIEHEGGNRCIDIITVLYRAGYAGIRHYCIGCFSGFSHISYITFIIMGCVW